MHFQVGSVRLIGRSRRHNTASFVLGSKALSLATRLFSLFFGTLRLLTSSLPWPYTSVDMVSIRGDAPVITWHPPDYVCGVRQLLPPSASNRFSSVGAGHARHGGSLAGRAGTNCHWTTGAYACAVDDHIHGGMPKVIPSSYTTTSPVPLQTRDATAFMWTEALIVTRTGRASGHNQTRLPVCSFERRMQSMPDPFHTTPCRLFQSP